MDGSTHLAAHRDGVSIRLWRSAADAPQAQSSAVNDWVAFEAELLVDVVVVVASGGKEVEVVVIYWIESVPRIGLARLTRPPTAPPSGHARPQAQGAVDEHVGIGVPQGRCSESAHPRSIAIAVDFIVVAIVVVVVEFIAAPAAAAAALYRRRDHKVPRHRRNYLACFDGTSCVNSSAAASIRPKLQFSVGFDPSR